MYEKNSGCHESVLSQIHEFEVIWHKRNASGLSTINKEMHQVIFVRWKVFMMKEQNLH